MRLTVYRGRETQGEGRAALCLCGGGITGALFETGVLAGLEDVLGRTFATEFDIYVGASAGASVASVLAQGMTAGRLFEALRDPQDALSRLRRENVYEARWVAWLRAAARLSLEAMRAFAPRELRRPLADRIAELTSHFPHGLFSTDRYQEYLRAFFARENLANRFDALTRELYIVANDVDSASRVVFGDRDLRGIDIATAVAASSAIPFFFEPVRIGGRDYFDGAIGAVPLDVAIAHGADRVIVVNPVVPLRLGGLQARKVRQLGPIAVVDQARRMTTEAYVHLGIKRQLAQHPHVDVLLIEPGETDAQALGCNPMSLRAGADILDSTRSGMRRELWKSFATRSLLERLATFTSAGNRTSVAR
jgi:NTE family protein